MYATLNISETTLDRHTVTTTTTTTNVMDSRVLPIT